MAFCSAELSIFLFFDLAFRSWCGRHYLSDGDFSPDCSQKKMTRRKKKKTHVNNLKRFDLQKKKTCQPQTKSHFIYSETELKWIASLSASAKELASICIARISAKEASFVLVARPLRLCSRSTCQLRLLLSHRPLRKAEVRGRNALTRAHHKKRYDLYAQWRGTKKRNEGIQQMTHIYIHTHIYIWGNAHHFKTQ